MILLSRQKITTVLLAIYWPSLFIVAHIPIPGLVRKAGVSDKALHFLAYLILVCLLWFAVSPNRKVAWRKSTVWWVFLAIVGYGIVDEWLQGYIAGRSRDVTDFAANLAGTFSGLVLCSFFSFWPVTLLVAAMFIFGLTNTTRTDLSKLVPTVNLIFHLFAYTVFTLLWIQCMHLFLPLKTLKPKWVIVAIGPPIGFLVMVKLFSSILGKNFGIPEVIISIVGIAGAVAATYLIILFRRAQN